MDNNIIEQIKTRLNACDLCPRRCSVNRNLGKTGFCKNTTKPAIYQHFIHLGEEISIVPAFIINMSGCSLNCPACSERCHFFTKSLPVGEPEHYASALCGYFKRSQMPASIEWIGGEPSTQLPFVLETSQKLRELLSPCPPILLNTNAYFDVTLLDAMRGIIDGFVFDLKCCPSCQSELTGVDDYWATVTNVIETANAKFNAENSIIRHLVMPGHFDCCTQKVVDWCRLHAPSMTFNLMTGFQDFRPNATILMIDELEKKKSIDLAKSAGFERLMIDGKFISGET